MVNINVSFPDDIRDLAELAAKQQGLSLDEFVRQCVVQTIGIPSVADPFYSDKAVFRDDGPTDMALNHDEYLYGDRQ